MARTNVGAVKALLGRNYDGTADLNQWIASATGLVTQASLFAVSVKGITLDSTTLELVERWLACHFYCRFDPLYNSKSTMGRSGSFQRGPQKEGFESTDYGRSACEIEYSGMLRAIGLRQVASLDWMGKPVSAQIPYDERD